MQSNLPVATGNVRVVARVRPLNKAELGRGAVCCLDFGPDDKTVKVNTKSAGSHQFQYDRVFDVDST
jgi:hypothetical protein